MPSPNDMAVLKSYVWGPDTIVVHDRIETVAFSRHGAPLSVKTTLRGVERYNVHGFFEEVGPGEHLVTNHRQIYESEISAEQPVESLSVFFSASDIADAMHSRRPPLEEREAASIIEFPGVKTRSSPTIGRLLAALPSLRTAPALTRQAHALALLKVLIDEEQKASDDAVFSAQRRQTREELRRRCLLGRAYIDAHFNEDIALSAVAEAAGLSRTHFLRSFTECFGETPYRALTRRRLDEAAALLKRGRASVSEIALMVGYSNFSAFSRAFRRRFGVAPIRYGS